MISVLHVITTIRRGGAENQLLTLARQQVATGKSTSVLFLKDSPELSEDFKNSGVRVINDFANISPLVQVIRLRKYLNNANFNIIHAHLPRAEILVRLSFIKKPYFYTRHNAEKFFPTAPKLISRFLSQFATRGNSRGIAISDAVAKFCLTEKEIRQKTKLRTVYYGYDPKIATFEGENQGREFTFGTVARLTAQKDIPTLLQAFAETVRVYPYIKLLIVGKGELENKLKNIALELNISDSLVWVEHTNDVDKYMRKIQTFVLSSKYEGFGLVLLEAMNAKCAILAASNSAIPEVLGSDFHGLFNTGSSVELSKLMKATLEKQFRDQLLSIQDLRLKKFDPVKMESAISNYYSRG